MPRRYIPQAERLYYLLGYLVILFVLNYLAFQQWLPPTDEKGIWFYSGTAALILGRLLDTPFFTSPASALSYAVAALMAIVSFFPSSGSTSHKLAFYFATAYSLVVITISVSSIITKDSQEEISRKISDTARKWADSIGNPVIVFIVVIFYVQWTIHFNSPREQFFIFTACIIVATNRPLEGLVGTITTSVRAWSTKKELQFLGVISAYQTPGTVLIRQTSSAEIELGQCLLIVENNGVLKLAVALGYVGRDTDVLLRAIEVGLPKGLKDILSNISRTIPRGSVSLLSNATIQNFRKDIYLLNNLQDLVGIVSQDTSVERLNFEIIYERDIEQGRLVETTIGNKHVLYQVLDGLTKEEIVFQKNTYGYALGQAMKIGIWDEPNEKFKPSAWIPHLNSAVFLKKTEAHDNNSAAVGYFPSTKYSVGIADIHELVTHNTAILGILGIGKSYLAIELVERMISAGIKVICLDLTNQYAIELQDFYDSAFEEKKLQLIQEAGQKDKAQWKNDPESGGSIPNLQQAIYDDIRDFILPTQTQRFLKIYNPARLFATRQKQEPRQYKENGQWHRSAGLWEVTPVEITRVVAEAALEVLQEEGMSTSAKVCLVFEEAHSLIPEFNTITVDGDQQATAGTARAILQGRKYGLGCLVITQRTASVTKTILNQCNTVFAMRTFDDTGKNFLSNYIGKEYSERLSALKERTGVFFGKASTCENPVLIRFNDRDNFLKIYREHNPPRELPETLETVQDDANGHHSFDFTEEDIPF